MQSAGLDLQGVRHSARSLEDRARTPNGECVARKAEPRPVSLGFGTSAAGGGVAQYLETVGRACEA